MTCYEIEGNTDCFAAAFGDLGRGPEHQPEQHIALQFGSCPDAEQPNRIADINTKHNYAEYQPAWHAKCESEYEPTCADYPEHQHSGNATDDTEYSRNRRNAEHDHGNSNRIRRERSDRVSGGYADHRSLHFDGPFRQHLHTDRKSGKCADLGRE